MTDKRETRLLVREGVRIGQDPSGQTVNKHQVDGARHQDILTE
jgi:hypothetical protein